MSSQRAGSTTCVIELNDTPYARDRYPTGSKTPYQLPDTIRAATPPAPQDEENRSTTSNSDNADPPASATAALQTWNNPPVNKWRILAAFFSFIVLGMNDAAPGALIPYLEKYYDLNFTVVSLIFLSPFVGYVSAAIVNNWIHTQLGRRGVGIVASGAHCLAYVVMSLHPPYPWLVVVMCLAGFGSGIMDAAWNSYIGVLDKSNEILGFLHGMYGLGATLSPIIATSMVTRGLMWYQFYYLMIGMAALAVLFSGAAFWGESATKYRTDHPETPHSTNPNKSNSRTREAMKSGVTWIVAAFLLIYVGAEVSLGGWIVTFMIRVREAGPFESGMVSAGFWIGLTVGRFVLGWVTGRYGERKMVSIYLVIAIALELVFWLVPQFYVSAISVALLGFFIGPYFPSAMVVQTKLLPPRLHVSAVGFAAAVGGSGAAIFPFAVGAIAQTKGVQTLHPVILALLVGQLGLWLLLPRIPKGHAS